MPVTATSASPMAAASSAWVSPAFCAIAGLSTRPSPGSTHPAEEGELTILASGPDSARTSVPSPRVAPYFASVEAPSDLPALCTIVRRKSYSVLTSRSTISRAASMTSCSLDGFLPAWVFSTVSLGQLCGLVDDRHRNLRDSVWRRRIRRPQLPVLRLAGLARIGRTVRGWRGEPAVSLRAPSRRTARALRRRGASRRPS